MFGFGIGVLNIFTNQLDLVDLPLAPERRQAQRATFKRVDSSER
jgi:hypothetical protein